MNTRLVDKGSVRNSRNCTWENPESVSLDLVERGEETSNSFSPPPESSSSLSSSLLLLLLSSDSVSFSGGRSAFLLYLLGETSEFEVLTDTDMLNQFERS